MLLALTPRTAWAKATAGPLSQYLPRPGLHHVESQLQRTGEATGETKLFYQEEQEESPGNSTKQEAAGAPCSEGFSIC